jgi:N-acetylmuramoyl-L-alanine amidase
MKKLCFAVITIICILAGNTTCFALSKLGSRGTEVTNIQTRLKAWGYYKSNVDGIYGTLTESAVRLFQSKNNLTVDGICGPRTLEKIGLPTGSTSSSTDSGNLDLIARVINGEARGESYTGQVAVGAVVLNRVKSSSFPNTVSGVIYQSGAFTAVSDGQFWLNVESTCYSAARDAMNGWDPTGGALYYYNPAKTSNAWMLSRPILITIGNHVFCK